MMNKNSYNEINDFFEIVKTQCYEIFKELFKLRSNIKDHIEIQESLINLKKLFQQEREQFSSDNFSQLDVKALNDKYNLFFNSYLISRGQVSKGKLDFFEYSLENITEYGIMEKNLSVMKKTMEVAWYGMLQQYGKLVLNISKQL